MIEENLDALREVLGRARMSPDERGRKTVRYNHVYLNYLPQDTPTEEGKGCPTQSAVSDSTIPDMGSQHTADEDTLLNMMALHFHLVWGQPQLVKSKSVPKNWCFS